MQIKKLNIADLHPYERNSRTHSPEQIEQIAASIREFGFVNPVLIDENNRIIAGHGRVLAAQKMGMEQVPCLPVVGLSDAQLRAYIIADNKLAENAGWDKDMLRLEFEDLKALDFDLDLLGFSADDSLFKESKKQKLTPVELDAPKMSWVLVGIPLVKYDLIAEHIEAVSLIDAALVQTTVTD